VRTETVDRRHKAEPVTKAYGETCPMCCGDLDDVGCLETGAIVCAFCDYGHERSARCSLDVIIPERHARELLPAFDVSRRRVAMEKSH